MFAGAKETVLCVNAYLSLLGYNLVIAGLPYSPIFLLIHPRTGIEQQVS